MKKVVVDTSVFIRLFTMDDEVKFRKARNIIEKAVKGKIEMFVPFIVVAEIVWVLEKAYKVSKNREKNIKFADAVISSWALHNKIDELITFDETDFKRVSNLKVRIL